MGSVRGGGRGPTIQPWNVEFLMAKARAEVAVISQKHLAE